MSHTLYFSGWLPDIGADPSEAIVLNAAASIGTENLSQVHTLSDGGIWYIAAPSVCAPSGSPCDLSPVLPGHPAHRGDGVYVHSADRSCTMVIVRLDRREIDIFCDVDPIDAEARSRALGVPLFDITRAEGLFPWVNRDLARERLGAATLSRIATGGWRAAVVGICALAVSMFTSWSSSRTASDLAAIHDRVVEGNAQAVHLLLEDPLAPARALLGDATAVAMRAGGRVNDVRLAPSRHLSTWTIDIPVMTPDAIHKLVGGRPVSVTPLPGDQMRLTLK